MSDDQARPAPVGPAAAQALLADRGYALTSDRLIGLPDDFRRYFRDTYFNSGILRHDPGDFPPDRERARDVIHYRWAADRPILQRYDTITITDRADIPGQREHTRVEMLKDPQAERLITALLKLVPPDQRQPAGTFGVNLFRTFTNVVTKPHYDHEELIITYVLDRLGEGAESYLYHPADVTADGKPTAPPVLWQQLNPGDILIFKDSRYKHGATPLIPPPGGTARRDVLVCTVDNQDTYLGRAQPV